MLFFTPLVANNGLGQKKSNKFLKFLQIVFNFVGI